MRKFLIIGILVLTFGTYANAQTTSMTYPNMTNACIDSTFKQWFGGMTSPTGILIEKRVTFNALATCSVTSSNSAFCEEDTNRISAFASGSEVTMGPSCGWSCGGCGNLTINAANDGLPVELMEFSLEGSE